MSGPKCSRVEAALDVVRMSGQRCRNRLCADQVKGVRGLLEKARGKAVEALESAGRVQRASQERSADLEKAPASAARIAKALESVRGLEDEARTVSKEIEKRLKRAGRLEKKAAARAKQGQAEYERARDAVRSGRTGEMARAEKASDLFDEASRLLNETEEILKEARSRANQLMRRAVSAAESMEAGRAALDRAAEEAEAMRRAEEEARREAEKRRREAVAALNRAREVQRRIESLPLHRLARELPGTVADALEAAGERLDADDTREAQRMAEELEEELGALEEQIDQELEAWQERQCAASAALEALAESLRAIDRELVTAWADDPGALRQVEKLRSEAETTLASEEDPGSVLTQATEAEQILSAVARSAAENAAADERRRSIGDAVMRALRDMGFDVSYQDGDRGEPMRIAGQTPDESGRGDFDIAIPLDGEVGFTVETPRGDASCVAAVEELRRRLAERGVQWETTDWGHAPSEATPSRGKERSSKEKVRERTRNRRASE